MLIKVLIKLNLNKPMLFKLSKRLIKPTNQGLPKLIKFKFRLNLN
jgi:hypothetical protein